MGFHLAAYICLAHKQVNFSGAPLCSFPYSCALVLHSHTMWMFPTQSALLSSARWGDEAELVGQLLTAFAGSLSITVETWCFSFWQRSFIYTFSNLIPPHRGIETLRWKCSFSYFRWISKSKVKSFLKALWFYYLISHNFQLHFHFNSWDPLGTAVVSYNYFAYAL